MEFAHFINTHNRIFEVRQITFFIYWRNFEKIVWKDFLALMTCQFVPHNDAPDPLRFQTLFVWVTDEFLVSSSGPRALVKELQDHASKTQDTLVDAVEHAEVAEIKRAVFRALTRLPVSKLMVYVCGFLLHGPS